MNIKSVYKHYGRLSALSVFALLALSSPAFATPAGTCGDGTMGGSIDCVVQESLLTQQIFPSLCYLFGIFIGVWAIAKFYSHVQNPNQTTVWEPIQRAVVAGALFALPYVMETVYNTIVGPSAGTGITDSGWAGTPTGAGLDAMVVSLSSNTFLPMARILMFFCYLAGLTLTVIGIMRLMKSAQEGARGPGGFGTIMTFLVAGCLFSADELMAAATNTIFQGAGGTVDTNAALGFNAGLTGAEESHVLSVISAVLAFVMILGWISFIRGWFIIRDVAEGNQQASLMAGLTHIFGGALAINLGPVLNAVQSTFGLGAIGVTFS